MLAPQGKLILTVPLGYNPDLDRMIRANDLGSTRRTYFRRTSRLRWEPCSKQQAVACHYRTPFPYANAILVANIAK